MFDYRRIALWIFALIMPGGLLLVPVLIADFRKQRARLSKAAHPGSDPVPRLAA